MAKASVGSHCSCFPDSSVVLQLVFREPEFAEKVTVFETSVGKLKVQTEILPRVNFEVTRKLMFSSEQSVTVLNMISDAVKQGSGKKLNELPLNQYNLTLVEQAMEVVCSSIQSKFSSNQKRSKSEIRTARTVETALVSKAQTAIESNSSMTLDDLISSTADEFADEYSKLCDRLSAFVSKVGAIFVGQHDIPKASSALKARLSSIVNNSWDVEVLSQAACRMIHRNRWSALVSFDFKDMVQNQVMIEKTALLLVCDPLYLGAHLQKRMDMNITPKEEARNRGLSDSDFVDNPSLMRIV